MAADPQRQETPTNDLFGRWLAHHEQQSGDQADPAASSEGTPAEPATPPASRRLPSAAVASSAVQRDPMIGSRIVPPSSFGTRRPTADSADQATERAKPQDWEPIVMRSVRTRSEKEVSKKTPKPADRPGRLQRLKARLVDPTPEAPDEAAEEAAEPELAGSPAPSAAPVATPAAPVVTRSIEETIRAAVRHTEAPVARHALPAHDAEPVRSAPQVPSPEAVAPAAAEGPDEVAPHAVRAFVDAPRIPEPVVEPVIEPAAPEAAEPVVAEPVAAEPVAAEPVAAEPVAAEPVVAEPVVAEPTVLAAEPVVEPALEPVPTKESVAAVLEQVAARVAARVTQIEPEPLEPQDLPESPWSDPDAASDEPPARFSFLSRSLRQLREEREGPEDRPAGRAPSARPGAVDAAPDQVAEEARPRASAPAPAAPAPVAQAPVPEPPSSAHEPALEHRSVLVAEPEPEVEAEPEPEVQPAPLSTSKHDRVATEMPGVYTFRAKRTVRRMLTIAMLMALVGTAYFGLAAYDIRDTGSIGLATISVLATAMLWAIRAGASVTKLEVHQGQLEVVQQGARFVFDLHSQYTNIQVHGEPGRRGWKVLFPRRGMAPFAVDASMVDPDDFMRVLRFFRPELVSH